MDGQRPNLTFQRLLELQLVVKCEQPLLNFTPLIGESTLLLEDLILELLKHLKILDISLLAIPLLIIVLLGLLFFFHLCVLMVQLGFFMGVLCHHAAWRFCHSPDFRGSAFFSGRLLLSLATFVS